MSVPSDFEPMHSDPMQRVELALADIAAGKMVILVDDEDRENEGDLVIAAEKITPEAINFMAVEARGLICLSMTGDHVDRLGLPMMATNNQSPYSTAFTVSIEAREGVTTGISAADRAHTVKAAIAPDATRASLVTPGHMFPLRARDGGVLVRVGQTEGSVDLSRIAGLDPSAVICEIMNPDGTMARLPELIVFGKQHGLRICAVADLIKYRMQRERIVHAVESGKLDLGEQGVWDARLYNNVGTDGLHLALSVGELGPDPMLVRVQTAPPAWSALGDVSSLGRSARNAMAQIRAEGRGVLVLMHLQGNDTATLRAAFHKDVGGDTQLPVQPRADALRDLGAGCQILADLGLSKLRLLSSSDRPIVGLEAYGLSITERSRI